MSETDRRLPVQKLVRLTAHAGRESELLDALRIHEAATRQEPECIEFTFLQAISNHGPFVLLEHFADEQAFKAHMQRPQTEALLKAGLIATVEATDVPYLGSK